MIGKRVGHAAPGGRDPAGRIAPSLIFGVAGGWTMLVSPARARCRVSPLAPARPVVAAMSLTTADCQLAAGLAMRHLASDEFAATPAPLLDRQIGAACFRGGSSMASWALPAELPFVQVGLPPLAGAMVEAWQVPAVRGRARLGAAHYAWSDTYLFGSIAPQAFADLPLQEATRLTYDAVFAVLARTGYRYLLRAWNYVPAINREADEPGGLERYRQFNLGRAASFDAAQAPTHEGAPAACALGTEEGGALCVYFLAMRQPPEPIENPRQVSAYRYPLQYGPRSPTFSRAALVRGEGGARLFISGTASIVGHQTVHVGDVAAQTRETLTNIDAVVTAARRRLGDATAWPLEALSYKAYVRHAGDLPQVQREVTAALGPTADVLYLRADICRSDLLVEIEGFG
jgi:chorismate lyase / 3-hydroxybenzoate synthase